ncbi:MAG: acetyl-coenzyme A synthetase, partial [Chlorobiales bacterium]|nr:acetyl-coenzyme A synthetase [Chlorobiales bacterium]
MAKERKQSNQKPAEQKSISSVLSEKRKFPPPSDFSKNAHISSMEEYEKLYSKAAKDPEKYWAGIAENFYWKNKWDKVLEWETPYAKWFSGGTTNICYNAVDRHV